MTPGLTLEAFRPSESDWIYHSSQASPAGSWQISLQNHVDQFLEQIPSSIPVSIQLVFIPLKDLEQYSWDPIGFCSSERPWLVKLGSALLLHWYHRAVKSQPLPHCGHVEVTITFVGNPLSTNACFTTGQLQNKYRMTHFLNFLKSCIRIFWNLSHMSDIYHKKIKNTQTIREAHSVHPCTLTTFQFKVSGS